MWILVSAHEELTDINQTLFNSEFEILGGRLFTAAVFLLCPVDVRRLSHIVTG